MSGRTSKIHAFFYRNRKKGIPNLMLFLAIGNVVIYVLYMLNQQQPLFYELLRFDYAQILHWQLWRLISYPLTFLTESALGGGLGVIWGAIGLLFYYYCGRVIEANWGVLRFNLYYLTGVVLMDVGAILISLIGAVPVAASTSYLNLTLFLAVATIQPDAMVRIYFVIPVKMKWLAWVYFGITLYGMVRGIVLMIQALPFGTLYLGWLMPIFALANYFLFFGKQFTNVLPDFMRYHKNRAQRQTAERFYNATQSRGPVYTAPNYRFRCTVCGRTDVSNPGLEFRYCSKCVGYRCYCIDHINNHVHISD